MLKLLPIARPCRESFAAMGGDDRTRFCESCGKDVHDLSTHTEEEARDLFARARGTPICVRYAKNSRGSVRLRAVSLVAAVSLAAGCSPVSAKQAASTPSTR